MARSGSAVDEFARAKGAHLGPFQLLRQLGKGGFAPVWLAREMLEDQEVRTVALKLFSVGTGSRAVSLDHVLDEARALCRVEHPNVVRFHTIANDPSASIVGLVMEYVHGRALDRVLEEKTFAVDDLLALASPIASALAAVHGVGLVHRDVKPANVIESAGIYKLIDFGIAAADPKSRTPGGGDPAASVSDSRNAGTIGYADPACLDGRSMFGPPSDLYSLGAMLYECMSGGVPSVIAAKERGDMGMDPEVLQGKKPALPLASVVKDVPPALAALVDALIDTDPASRPHSAEAVAWELERIRRSLTGRTRPLPPEKIGPFRGLGRFEADDRDVYFGRSVEIAASLELLRTRGLVALLGPSGSGKSSLARAGVMPAVVDGGLGGWPKDWDPATCMPGQNPWQEIQKCLGAFVDTKDATPESLVELLANRVRHEGRGLVLLVDQLEELVTLASDDERAKAVRFLARIGANPLPGLRAIVAARRDLLDPLLALEDVGRLLARGALLVSPMSAMTWAEVIDQALAAYGYALEDEKLRRELLEQLETVADAMPLVQFALTQLWAERDAERKVLTRAGLKKIGGIAGALERHAETTYARLTGDGASPPDGRLADGIMSWDVQAVLLELTTPQGTRAVRTAKELVGLPLPGLADAVLERAKVDAILKNLEENRLIVREPNGFTLAHEALLKQWERLRSWVSEARQSRELAAELDYDAKRWEKAKRDPELLWKGQRLAGLGELRGLSPLAREFATASIALAKSEEERVRKELHEKQAQRRRAFAGIAGAVMLVAGGVYGLLVWDQQKAAANTKRLEAQAEQREEQLSRQVEQQKQQTEAATVEALMKQTELNVKIRSAEDELKRATAAQADADKAKKDAEAKFEQAKKICGGGW